MRASDQSFYKDIEIKILKILKAEGVGAPPVEVEKIAKSKGAEIVPYEMGNEMSGILVIKGNRAIIGINPSQSKVRQRFTIAHELGHYLLHSNNNKEQKEQLFVDKDFIVKFRSKKTYSEQEMLHERQANAFAAALLMPKQFIFVELNKAQNQELSENELIEELARTFEVSVPAMTYRLSDLNVF
jgi:Zn-dependent peptidase ImmA (M78 family)